MLFEHPDHEGRRVRLAYCLNLHPAEDLERMLEGIRTITLPLRDRLARPGDRTGERFGAGLYLPAALARRLASPEGERDLERLAAFLDESGLDPFTYNAFPAGSFHASGLKARVFEPTWKEEARVRFTLDVAKVAARLVRGTERSHVSISTHSGGFGAAMRGEGDAKRCAENMARAVHGLHNLMFEAGIRVVLSLEAEPRALAGDSRSLEEFRKRLPERAELELGPVPIRFHIGTCLDTCHSAVEFEESSEAFESASSGRGLLGKIQFSSALALRDPTGNAEGVDQLLAMDEPRYLHQVTGHSSGGTCRVDDLPDLRRALEGKDRERWLACEEWRCHYHVPVDLDAVGESGLSTTRDHADRILREALADPSRWGTEELHVEIETYTWDVLPGPARGAGDQVDGLEREYRHVIEVLEAAGWRRDGPGAG